jgi:mannose-1-phosphate guanylyltransferase
MGFSAILLVGGIGTRLYPLTRNIPKPMFPVAGVPFIEHQISIARDAGVDEIVLATSFMAQVFEPYFGDGSRHGLSIKYAVEVNPLGTAGAIRNASLQLQGSGPVVIFNGDVLSGHDLSAQILLHLDQRADVTMHLTEVEDARPYGAVEIDPESRVLAFNEKMDHPPTKTINAGCYIFSREVILEIPPNQVVSIERETFPNLLRNGANMLGYVDNSYWLDIGTPAALLKASRDLVTGVIYSSATPEHEGEALLLSGVQVDQSATISEGTVIGEYSIINSGCSISASIIGADVIIGRNSILKECFVAANVDIPDGTLAQSSYFGF